MTPEELDALVKKHGGSGASGEPNAEGAEDINDLISKHGGMVGSFGDIPSVETLRAEHEANLEAGKAIDRSNSFQMGADVVRSIMPAAGFLAEFTPAAPFSPVLWGGGEYAAQQLEKMGGNRKEINPLGVAAEAGMGALRIPSPAKAVASRMASPKFWYPFLKAPEGAANALVNMAISRGADQLSSNLGLTEGETPPLDMENILTSMVAGGTISSLGSLMRINHIAKQANDLNYKKASDITYSHIGMPPKGQKAESMAKSFDNWFPIIHQYANNNNIKVESLDDLRNASGSMKKNFYEQAYVPTVKPLIGTQHSTQAIYDAVDKYLTENHKLMVEQPGLKEKILAKYKAYKDASLPFEDLLKLRASYNEATSNIQDKLKFTPGFKANLKANADLHAISAIRGILNDAVDQYYKGSPHQVDAREILRTYADIEDVDKAVKEASQTNDATQRLQRGQQATLLQKAIRPIARATLHGSLHSVGAEAVSEAAAGYKNPDKAIKKAFKLLSNISPTYQMPITGPIQPPSPPQEGSQSLMKRQPEDQSLVQRNQGLQPIP